MMVRFINRLFGTEMWVDESRVEEYKAAGHQLAAEAPAPAKAATKLMPEAEKKAEAKDTVTKPKLKKAPARKK